MNAAERLRAETGGEKKPEASKRSEPRDGAPSMFTLANDVDTVRLLEKLGVEHDEKFATCPGCNSEGALIGENGGLKCLHDTCKPAGPTGFPGFRNPVAIVEKVRGLDPKDAARWICESFGIPIPERKKKSDKEPDPTDDDDPRAPPKNSGSSNEDRPIQGTEGPPAVFVPLAGLIGPALDRASRRRSGEEKPVPVPFRELSEALGGGLWSGAHVLMSGTGTGKSQLCIQTALGAAKSGVPSCYVGLELDDAQIALRVVGEHIGVKWSSLYLGRCSESDIADARASSAALEGLPFYCDFGPARGWPASRLQALAEGLRRKHPTGPALIVLDYLQLVGDEPVDFQRRPDLRERIGGAAYAARDIARRYDVAVWLISSAARTHYGLLAGDFQAAGLHTKTSSFGTEKIITHPHVLMGLGKESGEIEFSADTSTVLLRWPARLEDGSSVVLAAVPKVRAGVERWCALRFGGGRFEAFPIASLDELPEPPKKRSQAAPQASDVEARVLSTVGRNPGLKTANQVADRTPGRKTDVLNALKSLRGAGKLALTPDGFVSCVGGVVPTREDGNR
jgi:hypothetical protein